MDGARPTTIVYKAFKLFLLILREVVPSRARDRAHLLHGRVRASTPGVLCAQPSLLTRSVPFEVTVTDWRIATDAALEALHEPEVSHFPLLSMHMPRRAAWESIKDGSRAGKTPAVNQR